MIVIGAHTYGCPEVLFEDQANLIIGKYCSIAKDVKIFLGGDHRSDWLTTFPFTHLHYGVSFIPGHPKTNGDVKIGNDVWLGTGVVIMSGVTIGNGAVIGAYSVVRENVPDYIVAYGNPIEFRRFRFEKKTVSTLKLIKWWEWPDDKVLKAVPILMNTDIEKLVEFWEKEING